LVCSSIGSLVAACGDDSDGRQPFPDGSISSGACATEALRTTGQVYYFCDCQSGADGACVAGDDANAGMTPDAPRRTLAAAHERFRAMNAGDTVALCRGGVWTEDGGHAENMNCTVDNPCDYRDYVPPWGSASTARPQIDASPSANVFYLTDGGGYRIWNLSMRTPDANVDATGLIRIAHFAHDIEMCNVRFDTAWIGLLVSADESAVPGVIVHHSEFYNFRDEAIFGGGQGFTIDSNLFQNNGTGFTIFEHTIYLNSPMNSTNSGMRIINNEIQTGDMCNGVMVVTHGNISDYLIENNFVTTTSTSLNCFGIQMAPGYGWDQFSRVMIRRNRVTAHGAEPIHVGACVDCEVTDNLMLGGQVGMATSGCDGSVACTQNLRFLNNTIYEGYLHLGNRTTGTGFTVVNNVIFRADGETIQRDGDNVMLEDSNWVRATGGPAAEAVFQDVTGGNFRALAGGPLDDAGSSAVFSPTAIGTTEWDPTDVGAPRSAGAIDVGAF